MRLFKWLEYPRSINSSPSDHFLETFIISELIKNKRNNLNNPNYDIYYYCDRDKKEIDLIIKLDNVIYPFEIKKTANPTLAMIDNFKILENKNLEIGPGGILCFYPQILLLNEKNKSFPISVIF